MQQLPHTVSVCPHFLASPRRTGCASARFKPGMPLPHRFWSLLAHPLPPYPQWCCHCHRPPLHHPLASTSRAHASWPCINCLQKALLGGGRTAVSTHLRTLPLCITLTHPPKHSLFIPHFPAPTLMRTPRRQVVPTWQCHMHTWRRLTNAISTRHVNAVPCSPTSANTPQQQTHTNTHACMPSIIVHGLQTSASL